MITLQRLRADNFKGLRGIDLVFPALGSVLIEGHNEAGKSTLFEAVYVALYGKPLVGEEKQPRLDDVIAFGTDQAIVELTFAVSATTIKVQRRFTRDKSQNATITITRPGAAPEERHGVTAVNARILREIGGLDGDTLRNSCFVEQKELARLEDLSKNDREGAIERLLGLRRLSKLEDSFIDSKKAAEKALQLAIVRLELAQAASTTNDATLAARQARQAFDAAQAAQLFDQLATLAGQADALQREATAGDQTRQKLDTRIAQAEALTRWQQQASACDPLIAQARTMRARIGRSETERAAHRATLLTQELPALEAQLAEVQRQRQEQGAVDAATRAHEQAARQRDALSDWLRVTTLLRDFREFGEREAALQTACEAAVIRAGQASGRARVGQLGLAMGVVLLAVGVFLIAMPHLNPMIAVALIAAGILAGLPILPLSAAASKARQGQDAAEAALRIAHSQQEVASRAGADPQILAATRERLLRLGIAEPVSVIDAEQRLAGIPADLSTTHHSASNDQDLAQVAAHLMARIAQLREETTTTDDNDDGRQGDLDRLVIQVTQQWTALATAAAQMSITPVGTPDIVAKNEEQVATALADLQQRVSDALRRFDAKAARQEREQLTHAAGSRQQARTTLDDQINHAQRELRQLLTAHGVPLAGEALPARSICDQHWPELASVRGATVAEHADRLAKLERAAVEAAERARTTSANRGLADIDLDVLDLATCEAAVDQARHTLEVCLRAGTVIVAARQQIMRQVLPVTERNMCLILPQLTAGRYHDVRLTPPEDANGTGELDYKIRVWDHAARRYVGKAIFSGGARDQCSLALRLAFALATLPQELGIAPGFLFLDEPLSAFDTERAGALVELLTVGVIAQNFAQVVVISHQHAYTHSDFRYHVRMERGRIVSSDLPAQSDPQRKQAAVEASTRGHAALFD